MSTVNYLVWEGSDDARRRAAIKAQDAKFLAVLLAAHPRLAPAGMKPPVIAPSKVKPPAAVAPPKRLSGPKEKIEGIIAEVASKHNLQPDDLTGKGDQPHIVLARKEAAYRLRTEIAAAGQPISYVQIGLALGGRNHGSITYAIRRFAASLGVELIPVAQVKAPEPRRDWLHVKSEAGDAPERGRNWKQIAVEVCEKHGVSLLDIRSARRDRLSCAARHEVWWRLKHDTMLSVCDIGRKLNRDHTTIIHGIARHEQVRAAQQ